MIAADLNANGRAKRYRTWEAALCYAMRGNVVFGQTVQTPMSDFAAAGDTNRAHWFASNEPDNARLSLLELAEGASVAGDTEAMLLYMQHVASMQEWLDAPRPDIWADPFADEPEPERHKGTRAPRHFQREQIAAILDAMPARYESNQRMRAIVVLMYATGLRVGECLAMRGQDWNPGEGYVTFPDIPGLTKTGPRVVPIPDESVSPTLHRVMAQWMGTRAKWGFDDPEHALFITRAGRRWDASHIRKKLKGAAERAGITDHVNPHMLRHTAASELLRDTDIATVAEILGHKNANVTRAVYCHGDERSMRAAMSKRAI